ncbi:hypothetical protein TRIATDRAFT_316922 [Trichoderma atroviride IMI 206040]|uniref:Xylanolytic transcriptional activator regulatory domain-containing protein n=1 Tax=Hypocrea atroviridis (strain ATCC 20476 / IMI 206040) TaxID=452589 RepID=G9NQV3_HYPAI|nr:uncharacterized protein TRIATDRAFT_316922 [Trichoderma atroviride IMI 206040]EHK46923.1 hypothetical protein TRIATDRAFT_316922 [Trichoderma atroviride IMI 206040]
MNSGKSRVMVACTHCRQRSSTFSAINEYHHDASSAASDVMLQRLESIEKLLGEHADALKALQHEKAHQQQRRNSPAFMMSPPLPDFFRRHTESIDNDGGLSPSNESSMPHSTWALTTQEGGDSSRQGVNGDDVPPITIPLGHQTSTSSLLRLPQMRPLVGDYPEDFFFRVEDDRSRSTALDFMAVPDLRAEQEHVDRTVADDYLNSFLAMVHAFHPIFDRDDLLTSYEVVMRQGLGTDIRSGVFLAIFALGATASDPINRKQSENTGDACMQRALRILMPAWTVSFSGNIQLSQGLILCALYFTYVVQPLTAWRLIHMAATSIQQLLIRCKDILSGQAEIQELTRLSWVCFIVESDILAEFHQPRSGIDVLVDRMPFPNYGTSPKLEHLCVLAEISARSLLNRMHHAIYFTDSLTIYAGRALDSLTTSQSASTPPHPDASLLRMCSELNFQLERWYEALPVDIKPDLYDGLPQNRQACIHRLRYWSAKQSIFRPFVIHATSSQFDKAELEMPPTVVSQSKVCLAACRAFLHGAGYLLADRTPYAYSSLQFSLNCFLVLALAANSPHLGHLVTDIDACRQSVVKVVEPWARPGTSAEHDLEIVNSVARKLRLRDRQRH